MMKRKVRRKMMRREMMRGKEVRGGKGGEKGGRSLKRTM